MLVIYRKDGVGVIEIQGDTLEVISELSVLIAAVQRVAGEKVNVYESIGDEISKKMASEFLDKIGFKRKEQSDDERPSPSTES